MTFYDYCHQWALGTLPVACRDYRGPYNGTGVSASCVITCPDPVGLCLRFHSEADTAFAVFKMRHYVLAHPALQRLNGGGFKCACNAAGLVVVWSYIMLPCADKPLLDAAAERRDHDSVLRLLISSMRWQADVYVTPPAVRVAHGSYTNLCKAAGVDPAAWFDYEQLENWSHATSKLLQK